MIRLVWSRTIAKLRAEKVDLVNGITTAMETVGRLTNELGEKNVELTAATTRIAALHLELEQAEAGHRRQIGHSRDLEERRARSEERRVEIGAQLDRANERNDLMAEELLSIHAHHGRALVELGDCRRHLRGLVPEARKAAYWLSLNCGTRSEGFGVFVDLDAALVDLGVACGTPSPDEAVRISKENC